MKNVVTKMYKTNTHATHSLLSYTGTSSNPTLSIALYIIPGHISSVDISKNVIIECNISS